ncbi:FAD-binding oxidoreductase [Ramlibacter henchirensis]|uniref:FAD-binding oxidoreductase n=1 Tax=Ramlibacter henchirensis TaxID=204072 RepID=A0A4Z0C3Z9_9BURK|nr:FAD-binding oxidoreductase [Ramlibacter henchirensis]TFZ05951.1 FAD-binding oxidoreductase [Ramlibacter henchirensis]
MNTTTDSTPRIPSIPGLLGQVLRPGDDGYDQARAVWNGAIDRRPGFIVRCRSSAEVASAVRFAGANGLLLAIKGGGHSIPGWSVCEGGLMIDLSLMKSIYVDVARRIAMAEPGLLLREYDAATQAHGLASPGGEISHTGLAGLTLGGGIGWLSRKHGLACDNLIEAEVVLADGSITVANERQNADLFWALRGGGGNFGVVTRFTFRVHEVAPMYAGFAMYPAAQAPAVLAHYERLTRGAPDELSLVAALVNAPPAPFVPPELQLQPVAALAGIWVGPADEGERALQAVRRFGNPAVDTFGEQPYTAIQQWFDGGVPHGLHYYCRSEWLKPLEGGDLQALADAAARRTSPMSQVLVRHMGGAVSRVDPEATAFRFRDVRHILTVAAAWQPGDEHAGEHRQWCRETWSALKPASAGGGYVNHLTEEGASRTREAYGKATWDRLVAAKRKYDPANLFRMNQNIDPGMEESGAGQANP